MSVNRVSRERSDRKIRYAVVGLGHISQAAVLPAFAHASANSQLTALISNDPKKLSTLGARYKVPYTYSYREYDRCLHDEHIDAVYIALPNNMHCNFAVRAAEAGIHVLCEKPMAVTERECHSMMTAARKSRTKLMIAYRLHFEEATVRAIEMAQSGRLGKIRMFNSVFSLQVRPGDIRVRRKMGGGSLYDIGIYCINAARNVFQENPVEVSAFSVKGTDRRFREVDEMSGAVLRFPDGKLASFMCSFGAADVSSYEIVGTKGRLQLDPAYEYVGRLTHRLTLGEEPQTKRFPAGDQFASELLYFSDCIHRNAEPEPSGLEGLIDVQIIEALYRSAATKRPVTLKLPSKRQWPTSRQIIHRPPVPKPKLVKTQSPSL
ncbi:glucose-fructose oxidoreductase [Nitrospira sp. KM1]|uniref:Gfo/Idh/MocA family protein n=1 Tax=Nitrospira sp. KM1 TaxID=1936990 RepID=UPI0013A745FF|nr:Gfo/Idh/MocA family oxidoreductase [Nitrospira sp. KM1]BCA56042.1 glucose-fructose oxidoreductase [Nitrospira sp. KM1]